MSGIPDEGKTVLCCGVLVAVVASAIAWPIAWYNSSIDTAAMKAGLVQREVPHVQGGVVIWVKADAEVKP